MSIRDDKKNILNKIGAFSSLRENLDTKISTNSMSSVSNKKDIIPFLLDVLKTIVGTEALKKLTGDIISNFIDKSESGLKKQLKKQFTQYNSDDNLPSNFVNNGIQIKIKKIDYEGKLKTSPTSTLGKSLYREYSFDKTVYESILNPNVDVNYENLITLKYNKNTDSILFKPYLGENKTIGNFFTDFIDKTTLIDKNEIVTKALNAIYGNIDKNQKKTLNEIIEEQKINKIIDKYIDDENFVGLTTNDLVDIEKKALNIYNGNFVHYMGCGNVITEISDETLSNTISDICSTTDLNHIGNVLESNLINDVNNSDDDAVKENIDSVKDNYFAKIIKEIVLAIVKSTTISPQIKMLVEFSLIFQNKTNNNDNDYVKNNSILIKCLIKELIAQLSEFIFILCATYLMQLIKPILIKMSKEKIKQYKEIIKSLTTSKRI